MDPETRNLVYIIVIIAVAVAFVYGLVQYVQQIQHETIITPFDPGIRPISSCVDELFVSPDAWKTVDARAFPS